MIPFLVLSLGMFLSETRSGFLMGCFVVVWLLTGVAALIDLGVVLWHADRRLR